MSIGNLMMSLKKITMGNSFNPCDCGCVLNICQTLCYTMGKKDRYGT